MSSGDRFESPVELALRGGEPALTTVQVRGVAEQVGQVGAVGGVRGVQEQGACPVEVPGQLHGVGVAGGGAHPRLTPVRRADGRAHVPEPAQLGQCVHPDPERDRVEGSEGEGAVGLVEGRDEVVVRGADRRTVGQGGDVVARKDLEGPLDGGVRLVEEVLLEGGARLLEVGEPQVSPRAVVPGDAADLFLEGRHGLRAGGVGAEDDGWGGAGLGVSTEPQGSGDAQGEGEDEENGVLEHDNGLSVVSPGRATWAARPGERVDQLSSL